MPSLAVITARGGSKRIPRKNIKLFRGKPIIAYSIETAIKSGLFERILVSTDDAEIADLSVQYGAEVPFFRSQQTSGDLAGTAEVLLEVIQMLAQKGSHFENICGIYPTAPFISVNSLQFAYDLLIQQNYTGVFPVKAFSYSIYRSLKIGQNGKVEMIWPENLNKRSQDLPPAYHDAGQFYWLKVAPFLQEKRLFTSNSGSLVLSELEAQDIDTEEDWEIAEIKYSILNQGE